MRRPLPALSAFVLAALLASCHDSRVVNPQSPELSVEPGGGGFSGTIAFNRIGVGMVIMKADVSEPDESESRVITTNAQCNIPEWSPDGTKIACTSRNDIFVMNADGSGLTNLTNHPALDRGHAWSGDGTRIAFASNRDGTGCEIYTANSDGTEVTQLTAADFGCNINVTWSPDGGRIAFQAPPAGSFITDIYVINADGSALTNLTNVAGSETAPVWSHDGTRIAFLRVVDSFQSIFVMNPDGSGVIQITHGVRVGAESGDITWSPDDRRIAFEGFTTGGGTRIFVTKVDQPGEIVQLTFSGTGGFGDIFPAWTWRRH
jgi:Tol biopolymer transport system component